MLIFSTVPEAKRSSTVKKGPMLVDVVQAEHGTFEPKIVATGTVRAEQDASLSARVAGAVIERSKEFSPGRFVDKGTVLLRIDPAGFALDLALKKSALAQARTRLRLEQGQQDMARQEYDALFRDSNLSEEEQELALRKPQLAAAQEDVRTAETAVKQAQLNLSRTSVLAPFDAQVIERLVDVGAHVQPGTNLGRLVGVDEYWVEASVPLNQRRWLLLPSDGAGAGAEASKKATCPAVELRNNASWPAGAVRKGCLTRLLGSLDEATRMARVLIEVEDPLARDLEEGVPPLMIGEFVQVSIPGKPLHDVVRIPRDLVRTGHTTWVVRDNRLHIVELETVLLDTHFAYDRGALTPGDRIVTTDLAQVREGAELRVREAPAETSGDPSPPEERRDPEE